MKYMGSKARFAKEILPIILKDRKPEQWYVEPFAGGMNTVSEVGGNRIANDANEYLIAMWEALVWDGWVPSPVSKKEYDDIRNNTYQSPKHIVGWAGFNCSYSGKFFGGYAGKTKTKVGTVRDYQAEALNNVTKQVPKMAGVVFDNKDYRDLHLPPNSIIYCDPPYKGTTDYGTRFDHDSFWEWVRFVSRKGHTVFVSEYSAPPDFVCVWHKEAKSSLSANGVVGGSKTSVERMFTLTP